MKLNNNMNLLIVIHNSMFDAALPLIKRLKEMCNLSCLLEFDMEESNIFGIEESDFQGKFYAKAIECDKIKRFEDFVPVNDTTIIKCYPPRAILRHIKTQYYENFVLKRLEKNVDFIYFYNTPLQSSFYIAFCRKLWGTAVHDPIPHSDQKHVFIRSIISYPITKKCNNYFLFSESLVEPFKESRCRKKQNVYTTKLGPYETLGTRDLEEKSNSHNGLHLLFFGKIKAYKGLRYLLEAYKSLIQDGINVSLTIAGSGFIEPDIIDLSNTPGLLVINRYITNEELAGFIRDSDLVVCPYTDATQSGVIMSSYAFCKPVIATNVGGLIEMVDDNKTGKIIPSCDAEALRKEINKVYENRSLLNIWSNNIELEYFRGNSSWDTIASNLIESIKSIISK